MSDGLETNTGYSLSTKAQVTNELLDCLRMFLEGKPIDRAVKYVFNEL